MDDYNTVFEASDVDSARPTDITQSEILLNSLDFPLDEVISGCQPAYATLTSCCQDESIVDSGLALNNFWHKSSLLANWFEETRSGYKCYLENIDPVPFVCFSRYIYSDDYEPNWSPSISSMARILHYAESYDARELAFDLQHDIETVLGHYSLQPPHEFFDAVRFIHDKSPSNIQVRKAVAEYCVFNFQSQELVEHTEFTKSLHELRSFLRDVCAANIQTGFKDEGALDSVRLCSRIPFNVRENNPSNNFKSDGGVIQEIWDAHATLDESSRPVTPIEQAIQHRRSPFRYSTTTASDTLPDSDQSDADDTKSHELVMRIKPRPDLDGEVYRGDFEGGSAEMECNTDGDDWVDVDIDVSESEWTMV